MLFYNVQLQKLPYRRGILLTFLQIGMSDRIGFQLDAISVPTYFLYRTLFLDLLNLAFPDQQIIDHTLYHFYSPVIF